jgi:hypothetical protein
MPMGMRPCKGAPSPDQQQHRLFAAAIRAGLLPEGHQAGEIVEALERLDPSTMLDAWAARGPEQGDLRRCLHIADELGLDRLGEQPTAS